MLLKGEGKTEMNVGHVKKRERQKKNAFVVFHAPENVKKENVRTKKCKNRKVRENIFLFLRNRN